MSTEVLPKDVLISRCNDIGLRDAEALGSLLPTDPLYDQIRFNYPGAAVLSNPIAILGPRAGQIEETVAHYLNYIVTQPHTPIRVGVGFFYNTAGGARFDKIDDLGIVRGRPAGMQERVLNEDFHATAEVIRAIKNTLILTKGYNALRIVIYNPDRNFGTYLAEQGISSLEGLDYEHVKGIGRLEGWFLAQKLGAPVPEGISVIADDIFHRWLANGKQFTGKDRELLLLAASSLVGNYGKMSVRRALALKHYEGDPGTQRGYFDKDDLERAVAEGELEPPLKIIEAIYTEALELARQKAEELVLGGKGEGLGIEELTQQLLGESKVCVVFHRFVDPIPITLGENKELMVARGQRLPASIRVTPQSFTPDSSLLAVAWGYGNARSKIGMRRIYQIGPTGVAQPAFLDRTEFYQDEMLCTVGGTEVWIPIPLERRREWPIQEETLGWIVRAASTMHNYAAKSGWAHQNFRLELSLGHKLKNNDANGHTFYITQATPCELPPDILRQFSDQRMCLVVRNTDDIVTVRTYVEQYPEDRLFIAIPQSVVGRKDWLEQHLVPLVKSKEGIVVLVGADFGAGHFLDTLSAEEIDHFCVGSFPIEFFDRLRVSLSKDEGPDFNELARLWEEGQAVLPIETAWQWGNSQAGNKGYYLSRAGELGFDIARGGVIPAAIFNKILERVGQTANYQRLVKLMINLTANQPADLDGVAFNEYIRPAVELAQAISGAITHIPQEVMAEVEPQLRAAFGGEIQIPVMARSAATAEDSKIKAAPGVFETVGGTRGLTWPELTGPGGIVKVYQSLLRPEAIAYMIRNFAGAPQMLENLGMAVVVPEFKPIRKGKDFSFYLFTAQKGHPEIAKLSLGFGQGEEIAKGVGEGRDIWFNKETGAIVGRLGNMPEELAIKVRQIVATIYSSQLINKMERLCGREADIEGAFIGDEMNQFSILLHQVRPFFY